MVQALSRPVPEPFQKIGVVLSAVKTSVLMQPPLASLHTMVIHVSIKAGVETDNFFPWGIRIFRNYNRSEPRRVAIRDSSA
jgi:hypothetical protein